MSQSDNLRDRAEASAKDNPEKVEQAQQKADDLVGRDGDEPSTADRAKADES